MKILLILSLVANLLLAGWWVKQRSASHAAAPTSVTTPAVKPARFGGTTWADLQTDDLRELIKRLRAAGCPEETVQNIVLANVSRRFAAREQNLFPEDYTNHPFWEVEKQDAATLKKQREDSQHYSETNKTLETEKSTLLVKLLGVDPEQERQQAAGIPSPAERARAELDFLPGSKQEAVAAYLEDFNRKAQEFYDRVGNNWNADARAEQHRLEDEKLNGLAQILSPSEVREYQLRLSPTAEQIINQLHGVTLTHGEYEALFDLQQKYGDSVILWSDAAQDPAKRAQVEDNQRALKADIAFALGADKAVEIERAGDPSYQQLASYARHYQLPPDTAAKVYTLKQTAEAKARQIQANTGLEPSEQAAALQKLRAETESSVKSALGDEASNRYLNRDGAWLQNLSPNSQP